jgi:hypothetical protein
MFRINGKTALPGELIIGEVAEIRHHERSGTYPAFGASYCYIWCPWCKSKTRAYIWSLSGGGKRCDGCGVMHCSGGRSYRKYWRYLNPFHREGSHDSKAYFESDTKPAEYRGYHIFQRVKGSVFDVVKDGVLFSMRAGRNGAKKYIDTLANGYGPQD